jgi:acyl dehydratase
MVDASLERLESMVGESKPSVENLVIEAGKVEEFARALKNDNPAFRSLAAAREQGFDRVPAPITFLRTALFPRYDPGDPGLDPDRFPMGFDLGFDLRYRVHGEQAYDLERPLFVGDTLTGKTTLTDVSRHEGEQGTLTRVVLETEYVDEGGDLVATERKTILEAPGTAGDGAQAGTVPAEPASTAEAEVDAGHPEGRGADDWTPPAADEVAVGDTGPELVERFDLKDFVRYAGASCGFDRIHYDRDFVREAGYPDAFAHGMLTAGVVEHMVTDWLGLASLARFRTRFLHPLYPGDTLRVRGEVVGKEAVEGGATVEVDLEGLNGDGETVVEGDATARLAAGE